MNNLKMLKSVVSVMLIVMLLAGSVAIAESFPTGTYYCNGNRVNVRSGPSSGYSSQYKLVYGDVVSVTGSSNGWAKISYYNKNTKSAESGYIYRKYLSQVSTSSKSSSTSGSVYKTTANLRVRSEASTEKGYIITKLKKGTKVKVSKQKRSWVYVTYSGGSGWVSAKYLKKVG